MMEKKIFNLVLNLSAFYAASFQVIEITVSNKPDYLQFKAVISAYLYECLLVDRQNFEGIEIVNDGDTVILSCSFLKTKEV